MPVEMKLINTVLKRFQMRTTQRFQMITPLGVSLEVICVTSRKDVCSNLCPENLSNLRQKSNQNTA